MENQINYIGPYRMKSEAFLYSRVTVNGMSYRVPDAVGATIDGHNVLRLMPNEANSAELVNLVQDGDLLGYIRAPLNINISLMPYKVTPSPGDIIKGRISHAEIAYNAPHGLPRQISLWAPGNSCQQIQPSDRALYDNFDKPPIGIYRVSLRKYGVDAQCEKELKAEVRRWMKIVKPVIFPHETMETDPVDFINVETLARIAARCISRSPSDKSPLFDFKLNCVQWSTLVFCLAVCFPLSRATLCSRGWLENYEHNWGIEVGFAENEALTGLDKLPIPFYTINDAIENTLDLFFPNFKEQIRGIVDSNVVAEQLHAKGISPDQRTIMPAAFMLENRLGAMGIQRKTDSVFEYVATVVPEDQLTKVEG